MQDIKENKEKVKDIKKDKNLSYLDRVLKVRLRHSREKSFLQPTTPSK